jgi:hypothetical protein
VNRRLINEVAFLTARELLGKIAHNYREEEHRDIFEEFFETCKAGMESYCLHEQRIQQQLRPLEKSHAPATGK